jgi:hypothetical protein
MQTTDWIQFISLIIALAAIFITVYTFKQQLKQNFFTDYTKRYQEIMLHLPDKIFKNDVEYDDLDCETKCYLRAYIDLCSEEYYLKETKKIDKKVWENWEEGMKSAFSKTVIKKAWQNFDKSSYKDFARYVRDELIY